MAVKGEMKEESQEEMVKEVARRVAVGLEEQVCVALPLFCIETSSKIRR